MGFNTNARQRHLSALRDLDLKLSLERLFAGDINRFLKDSYREALKIYAETGMIIPFSRFRNILKPIIYKHYRRVQKVFAFQMRLQITKQFSFLRETKIRVNFNDGIAYQLEVFGDRAADKTTMEVLKTSQSTFEDIIDEVAEEYLISPTTATYGMVANESASKLESNADWRARMISTTETQNAAENAKFTEARAFYDAETFEPGEAIEFEQQDMFKYWESILDNRTREWHAEADGQKVLIDEPFIVNGEELMYPRDDSFGASLDNIINCRCSSVYANANL